MTSPPEKRDFSALGRKASGLRTGAPPPSAAPAPAPHPEPEPQPEERQPESLVSRPEPSPEPSAPRRRPGRPASGRKSREAGIPADLHDKMADAADRAGIPYGDWLMATFNDVYDKLEEVYPPLPTYRPELPPPRRPPRQIVWGGRRSTNFRLTPEQLDAIVKRQDELQVESRSEFMTAIVELGLAPD